jgi:DNA-binding LacI/PurR family transcriptional regulator
MSDSIEKKRSIKKRHIGRGAEIEKDITAKIASRELAPGDALLSTAKIAEHYGVSLLTAQRALSKLAASGCVVRKNGCGTFVAEQKSAFPFEKLGFMVFHHHNPFHAKLAATISDHADTHNVRIVLGEGYELDFIEKMAKRNVKAMIRYPREKSEEQHVWSTLSEHGIKTVVINDFWLNGGVFPCVSTDDEHGVSLIMEHLISLGHERIVLVDESSDERRLGAFNGYCRTLMKHGLKFDDNLIKFVRDHGRFAVSETLLDSAMKAGTAAIFTYDYYAIQFIELMNARSLTPGKDFSVAGFDDVSASADIGLTTVRQNIELLVENAFEMLCSSNCEKVLVKPELIVRNSCGKRNGKGGQ